ncbi:MAG: hypothetical protein PUF11_04170 [Parafannyhessea umbonata]|uniref:phage terminase small subunit n=1 Tax=Parafannyhessea umbonata TaxID=604330 RepID=UPI0026F2A06D|nr:hypothetical protein [Parafannyhessea umbonata]MDD6565969.1 hypothetical protein [Parafannyhessea umbonata]
MKKDKPRLPDTVDWPEETEEWFESWRSSPVTDGWTPQQWSYLIDTALVHAEVWGSNNIAMLGELHRREAYMGVTFDVAKAAPQKTAKASVLSLVISDRQRKAAQAQG